MYYYIIIRKYKDIDSTNNDVSCDGITLHIETQEQKCEEQYINHLFMISFSLSLCQCITLYIFHSYTLCLLIYCDN